MASLEPRRRGWARWVRCQGPSASPHWRRPTGQTMRRYEHDHPGDLVHVDTKKLGKVPPGGGWRIDGRAARPHNRRGPGYCYVHSAVDDHSRLAYSALLRELRLAPSAVERA